jgi:hypothetical protein
MPPAVLADIGRRALAAEDGGGAVVIGEGAGLRAGSVIMQKADRVGQPPVVQVMTIVAGIGQTGGQSRGGEEGGGNEKLRFGHFDSPESPTETVAISSRADSHSCEESASKQQDRRRISDSIEAGAPDILADLISHSRRNG